MSLGLSIGYFAFFLAVCNAFVLTICLYRRIEVNDKKLLVLANFIFGSSLAAFIYLVYSYITSDFSYVNVYLNSHQLKPLLYKITGSWGNHEGSILLYILLLSLALSIFIWRSKIAVKLKQVTSIIYSSIIAAFYAYLLFLSYPFARLTPVPDEGKGLIPLLQDVT